jgi:hypothetical protein
MTIHCFVDANHANNKETSQSQRKKKKTSLEASTFGSEFTQ